MRHRGTRGLNYYLCRQQHLKRIGGRVSDSMLCGCNFSRNLFLVVGNYQNREGINILEIKKTY